METDIVLWEDTVETLVILAEDLPEVEEDTEEYEEAEVVLEHSASKRTPKPCGWWTCKQPSFAQKYHQCPHCKRPKSGPKEG